VALDRLCQFRAAHLEVLDFRRRYRETLANVRERRPFEGDPVLREAVESRDDLIPVAHRRRLLRAESERVAKAPPMLLDEPLKAHLASIYSVKLAEAEAQWTRGLEAAYETVADQLLAVDEQMTILDYEIGVGLFKGSSIEGRKRDEARPGAVPLGGDRVYYRFDGEYWSDEIQDFAVLADDRCLR